MIQLGTQKTFNKWVSTPPAKIPQYTRNAWGRGRDKIHEGDSVQFSSVQSTESVMPYNHLILCHPLLLLPSIFPSIRVFSNESALCIQWPKYWSFSFNISPSNEHPGLTLLGWTGWISWQSNRLSRVFSNTTVQKHQFFSVQLSL